MDNIYYGDIFCGNQEILSDLIINNTQIETYIYDLKNIINKLEFNNIQTLSYYKQLITHIKKNNKRLSKITFHHPENYHKNDVLKFCGFDLNEPYIHILTYNYINNKISIPQIVMEHLKKIHLYIYKFPTTPPPNKKLKN